MSQELEGQRWDRLMELLRHAEDDLQGLQLRALFPRGHLDAFHGEAGAFRALGFRVVGFRV